MSLAEELLNSIDETTPEGHIVIGSDRYVTVPDELKRLAVQYDHDIETVTFDCPRYWDGIDMSVMKIYINYLRIDNEPGMYIAKNVTVDDSDETIMHFDWTISRNVTMLPGKLVFLVCIKKADSDGNEVNHWNSELCKDCYISEGLECDQTITLAYPDILAQWYAEVTDTKNLLLSARDAGEFDGATFMPHVALDGTISWTNDKGKTNPKPANIRGSDGVSPVITVTDTTGGHRVTITDVNGTQYFDVKDTTVEASDAVNRLIRNQSVTAAGDGTAYTVTINGITSLDAGLEFVIIPDTDSTVSNPTLNLNGLGAKYIRRRLSSGTKPSTDGGSDNWLAANSPVRVMYDGMWWIADVPRPVASDIIGVSNDYTTSEAGSIAGSVGVNALYNMLQSIKSFNTKKGDGITISYNDFLCYVTISKSVIKPTNNDTLVAWPTGVSYVGINDWIHQTNLMSSGWIPNGIAVYLSMTSSGIKVRYSSTSVSDCVISDIFFVDRNQFIISE